MDVFCTSLSVTFQTFWRNLAWLSSSRRSEIITFSTRYYPTKNLKSWVGGLDEQYISVPVLHSSHLPHLPLYICVFQRCCWSQIIPTTMPSSLRGKPKWPPLMMQKNWWQLMSGFLLFFHCTNKLIYIKRIHFSYVHYQLHLWLVHLKTHHLLTETFFKYHPIFCLVLSEAQTTCVLIPHLKCNYYTDIILKL